MESIDVNLDRIVDILYDEKLLQWKRVSSRDIITFGHHKFNLTISDAELDYVLTFLIREKYVEVFPKDGNFKEFGLTLKGVQIKQNGGFAKQTKIEKQKQNLYKWSLNAIIAAGVYYVLETIKILLTYCNQQSGS